MRVAILPSLPHPTRNILQLYGLDALAASVARRDPTSGQKINVLRKSYKGKIKDFPGKSETLSKDGQLFDLLTYPDEEWAIQRVQDNDLEIALTPNEGDLSEVFMSRINTALEMTTRSLPPSELERWRNMIDLDSSIPKLKVEQVHKSGRSPGMDSVTAHGIVEEPRRPKRKGTARNYHDEAFEGYAEGFGDDLDDLSIDGDDDRRGSVPGSKKRRRRVCHPHFI